MALSSISANQNSINIVSNRVDSLNNAIENRYTKEETRNLILEILSNNNYTKEETCNKILELMQASDTLSTVILEKCYSKEESYARQEVIDKLRALYKSLYVTLYSDVLKEVDKTIKKYHSKHSVGDIYLLNPDVPLDFIWKNDNGDIYLPGVEDSDNKLDSESKPLP